MTCGEDPPCQSLLQVFNSKRQALDILTNEPTPADWGQLAEHMGTLGRAFNEMTAAGDAVMDCARAHGLA